MGVSYNRNAGPVADVNLVLLVVNADVSVRTQCCLDLRLK